MTNLIGYMIKLLIALSVLTASARGLIPEGVVNLLMMWAWIEVVLLIVAGLGCLSDEILIKVVKDIQKNPKKIRLNRIRSLLISMIALTFVYWSYWITGIALMIGMFLMLVASERAKDQALRVA
ncbi:hypothetical protein FHO46_08600 [Vibrio cholerae]|uniref:hypothetical protein n=1 Tax=Vibrio cholerae TaxID=666 RepID=UPI00155EAA6F|nr:hypothetical protein [Vibrio cholerae]EGR0364815.1 hypothetical protein [Vibrio cholerae]EJK2099420.1 hypothetical protein [Vibrio cholerae]EKF9606123.1 hypothetical protein [Vibrio cholerae]ELK1815625.1 hypothetical protein [Vibrio cholerae]ELR6563585.1 hypothetical protein [Vibrio cholerae]